jgi:hypothetical protein
MLIKRHLFHLSSHAPFLLNSKGRLKQLSTSSVLLRILYPPVLCMACPRWLLVDYRRLLRGVMRGKVCAVMLLYPVSLFQVSGETHIKEEIRFRRTVSSLASSWVRTISLLADLCYSFE